MYSNNKNNSNSNRAKKGNNYNKREEILNQIGNGEYNVFYTTKMPKNETKNTVISFGKSGFIEKNKTEDGKTIYRVYDIPNKRVIDLRDDQEKIESDAKELEQEIINNTLRAYKIRKSDIKKFDEGISIFTPDYGTAIDAVATLEFNGKMVRVPFKGTNLEVLTLHRDRSEDGIQKKEVFIEYRYELDAIHSFVKNNFKLFEIKSNNNDENKND